MKATFCSEDTTFPKNYEQLEVWLEMVPHSFCWIRLVKLWIISQLSKVQVCSGSDFAKTCTALQLHMLQTISSNYIEVIVKEAEHVCRLFAGWKAWQRFEERSFELPLTSRHCMKTVLKHQADLMVVWWDWKHRKPLKLTSYPVLQNHEAWIIQTNSGAVFWLQMFPGMLLWKMSSQAGTLMVV